MNHLRTAGALALFAAAPLASAQGQQDAYEYTATASGWVRTGSDGTFAVDPDVVSVRFAGVADLDGLLADVGTADPRLAGLQTLRTSALGVHDLRVPAGGDVLDVVAALRETGLVEFAEENTIGEYVVVPNDPQLNQQYHLINNGQTGGTVDADLDAELAWDLETGDRSVVIALLDSGTEITHSDLSPNVWQNTGELPGNGIDDDGNGLIDDVFGWDFNNNNNDVTGPFNHGTFVAGMIGARNNNGIGISGLAGGGFSANDGCLLMCLGVGDFGPNGAILDDAIIYAVNEGAAVITMSLTVGQSSAIDNAVIFARTQGVFVDCAAGNNGFSVSYPARLPEVVSVASTNHNDQVSSFSNPGPENSVSAAGDNVRSTTLGNSYTNSSGTSFSAPQVAALAGLLKSALPGLTPVEMETIMQITADDVGAPGFDVNTGWGRINAAAAIQHALDNDCNGDGLYDPTQLLNGQLSDLNGNGTPDQCEGNVANYCQGKLNSTGCVPFLATSGLPSASSTVSFFVAGRDLVPSEAGLFLYGSQRANLNFHGGKLCVKAPLTRLLPPLPAKNTGTPPCSGQLQVNFNNRIQNGSDPSLTAGRVVRIQLRQRDPADPAGFGDSLTDGVEFTILP